MGISAGHQAILDTLMKELPYWRALPVTVNTASEMTGIPAKEIRAALRAARAAGLLDREMDLRVSFQRILDERYSRSAHLVCAPLLTADEIRQRDFVPKKTNRRPFLTLAVPREFAQNQFRLFSYVVEDDAMAPVHILKGDAVICGVGLTPQNNAPALFHLPDGRVLVRIFYQSSLMLVEMRTPGSRRVEFFYPDLDKFPAIGPIISVQRFCRSWRMPLIPPEIWW